MELQLENYIRLNLRKNELVLSFELHGTIFNSIGLNAKLFNEVILSYVQTGFWKALKIISIDMHVESIAKVVESSNQNKIRELSLELTS